MGLAACAGQSASAWLTYQRNGGFAGADDRLSIASDGAASLSHKGQIYSFTVAADQIQRIQQALDAADFAHLPTESLPDNMCCDLFEYRVTYMGRTVHAMDTAIPQSLQMVLDLLNEIVDSKGV